jgi:hypothetical protein
MSKAENEKILLLDCMLKGSRLLTERLREGDLSRYFVISPIPAISLNINKLLELIKSNNPDMFYTELSVLTANEDRRVVDQILKRQNAKSDYERALDYIETALYRESEFELELMESISSYVSRSDVEIGASFLEKFTVDPLDIMEMPTEGSVYFSKVNHGLWEFIRGAYDRAHAEHREHFRAIDDRYMEREARTSGLTQLWGWLINRYPSMKNIPGQVTSAFCISLTAGNEAPQLSIRKGLNTVTRGAAIGLLAMFETAVSKSKHFHLGDGMATRSLVTGAKLQEFFEKYVSDSEACLFLIPPHLKLVDFLKYNGDVHKLLIPPSKVNDNWKTVLATSLGYLQRMAKKYKSITVLAQGASVVSALGLMLAEMDEEFRDTRIRYFDMGRILDVTTPDTLQRQAWASQSQEAYIEEGRKVFRTLNAIDFTLTTQI